MERSSVRRTRFWKKTRQSSHRACECATGPSASISECITRSRSPRQHSKASGRTVCPQPTHANLLSWAKPETPRCSPTADSTGPGQQRTTTGEYSPVPSLCSSLDQPNLAAQIQLVPPNHHPSSSASAATRRARRHRHLKQITMQFTLI